MPSYSFGRKGGRSVRAVRPAAAGEKPVTEEVIRELKKGTEKPKGEDYREKSLAIHGMVCGRCGREFDHTNRHLLTVHHRDGNHHNNPPDGSNWENLCVYCHDDVHSRSVLAEYVDGGAEKDRGRLVYSDEEAPASSSLGELMRKALEKKGRKE
ncbi:MAG: HNH nuclease family protein [Deltaproteobacteria bacterium]|nr:HNH nuclease family protein [Deltaproteobacteria bacterium]